jgi:transcriptional regulator with PAS, ATPase and Fis domain
MTDPAKPKRAGRPKAVPAPELTPVSEVGGLTSNLTPDDRSLPREPETDKARALREQYLACARVALADPTLSYPSLYQRYASDQAEVQQAAQSLDQAVAQVALQSGQVPRGVTQLLAQGPFTQFQTRDLSPEARQAALPGLLEYVQTTVEAVQRQRFVEYANVATGKVWNYPDLYREHIGSDLVAIQLDQRVAAAALQGGEGAGEIAALLQQSPYARFQREVKQVSPEVIEQYAKGTVAQVQEIQSLRPVSPEISRQRSQSRDRG